MNPKYIYVSGETFYLINQLPFCDFIGASYEAMHRDAFGHAGGQPCRPGGSYSKHFAVDGLFVLATA
jgi:hypothetical protein